MMILGLALALLAPPQEMSPAVKKKIDAARAAVEKAPEDAKANLELGKLLCFDAGDWAGGLPHLAKGGDSAYAALAEKDLAGGNHLERVDVGDQWFALGKKQKPIAAACTARALACYGEAWPKLDDTWRDKMRERLGEIQKKGPESKSLGAYPGVAWGQAPATRLAGVDREYAHSGQTSLKVLPPDPNNKAFPVWMVSEQLPCRPGQKVTFTFWILTNGGAAFLEEMRLKFRDGKQGAGEHLALIPFKANSDLPIWTKVEGEAVAPDGCMNVELSFKRNAGVVGAAFIDDVSLKVDGKELLKNGGFELK